MRTGFRLLFVAVGMGVVGWRALAATRDWREWHAALGSDPSAAEAWRTFFLTDTATVVAAFGGMLIFLAVLRRLDRAR